MPRGIYIRKRKDPWDLLWKHVDKNGPIPPFRPDLGPCWIWLGNKSKKGYGLWSTGDQNHRTTSSVHTVLYEKLVGPVPDGLELDHLCRMRACCNPMHLEPVTGSVNVRRGDGPSLLVARNKSRAEAITYCPQGHPYDERNTYVTKSKSRVCRACRALSCRDWRASRGR